ACRRLSSSGASGMAARKRLRVARDGLSSRASQGKRGWQLASCMVGNPIESNRDTNTNYIYARNPRGKADLVEKFKKNRRQPGWKKEKTKKWWGNAFFDRTSQSRNYVASEQRNRLRCLLPDWFSLALRVTLLP